MMDRDTILKLEAQRCEAITKRDIAALDALLSPSLWFVHSTGQKDTKQSLLASIESGPARYFRIQRSDLDVRILSEHAAAVSGQADMDLEYRGVRKHHCNRFMSVWMREGEAIRMVAWQSSSYPAGMSVPPVGPDSVG